MKLKFHGKETQWELPQFLYASKEGGIWSCGILTLPTEDKVQSWESLSWYEVGQEMGGN